MANFPSTSRSQVPAPRPEILTASRSRSELSSKRKPRACRRGAARSYPTGGPARARRGARKATRWRGVLDDAAPLEDGLNSPAAASMSAPVEDERPRSLGAGRARRQSIPGLRGAAETVAGDGGPEALAGNKGEEVRRLQWVRRGGSPPPHRGRTQSNGLSALRRRGRRARGPLRADPGEDRKRLHPLLVTGQSSPGASAAAAELLRVMCKARRTWSRGCPCCFLSLKAARGWGQLDRRSSATRMDSATIRWNPAQPPFDLRIEPRSCKWGKTASGSHRGRLGGILTMASSGGPPTGDRSRTASPGIPGLADDETLRGSLRRFVPRGVVHVVKRERP